MSAVKTIVNVNVKNIEWDSDRVDLPVKSSLRLDGSSLMKRRRTRFIANEDIVAAACDTLSDYCNATCTSVTLDGYTIDTENNY